LIITATTLVQRNVRNCSRQLDTILGLTVDKAEEDAPAVKNPGYVIGFNNTHGYSILPTTNMPGYLVILEIILEFVGSHSEQCLIGVKETELYVLTTCPVAAPKRGGDSLLKMTSLNCARYSGYVLQVRWRYL